jgi:hypothetical protein
MENAQTIECRRSNTVKVERRKIVWTKPADFLHLVIIG